MTKAPADLDLSTLAPVAGIWECGPESARYVRPQEGRSTFGLTLTQTRLRSGRLRATATFERKRSVANIAFGYNAESRAYFSLGIGGGGYAYALEEFVPGFGWRNVRGEGGAENLVIDTPYSLEVNLKGQRVRLSVNGVIVLEHTLPHPITGDQVGLYAFSSEPVRFERVSTDKEKPQAFVVMQFGEPYDTLYSQVIAPVAVDSQFSVHRADDVFRPGVVLQEIVKSLVESEVIVAEITPTNPNVFYEIGYAHALGKPTILLAERGCELPFDVSSYRCIFYEDSIGGKKEVETALKKYLIGLGDVL